MTTLVSKAMLRCRSRKASIAGALTTSFSRSRSCRERDSFVDRAIHWGYHHFVAGTEKLRDLPSVHEVVERLGPVAASYPHELVVAEVRRVLHSRRTDIRSGVAEGP